MTTELTPLDALVQASFLIQELLEQRAGEHGISLIQTRLLGILRDRTPTMNELAQMLGLDKSSTTGLVDRAQRRGLVRRVPSQLDRRSVRVRLTDEGREHVQAVASAFAADIAAMLEPLTVEDRDALTRHLSQMVVAHAAAHGVDLFPTGTP
jgi:DNA-binding MarR family transcriptional regulator